MKRISVVLALALLLTTWVLPGVLADHEPSHRYFISGTVRTPTGAPACGVVVEAEGRRAATNERGEYRLQLHLHDSTVSTETNDEGKTIVVRVVGTNLATAPIATPGPAEGGWGESRVDFEVPPSAVPGCPNVAPQVGLLIGIPLAVVAAFAVAYFKVLKPWWVRRPKTPPLSSMTGIGKGRLRELNAMGIATLQDLADASPATIARETSVGKREAKRMVRRAQDKLESH